ncbi:GNL3L/Grn1 putative GTPase family protein [Candida albicans]|uniref:GNL3L/Grn1 putative GTPase family protein n=1 Tax=Candida albicans TaxID=5476 RepID=A0A8H6F544_CANAX|nr:GNL3L/Grn1 putative GTPase family protein [Candida albicans]
MRVKKPTSKRTTTRMREGIKKKAAAKRRKDKKIAKKDVTWKSRKSKDPGIPASFPYKDKIITELEEGRRIEKERREQLKLQKQQERQELWQEEKLLKTMMKWMKMTKKKEMEPMD